MTPEQRQADQELTEYLDELEKADRHIAEQADALGAANARIAELSAAPDADCWKQLVALASKSDDPAMLIFRITSDYNRMRDRIADLSEENSQMARMLAEPSENQELKARIAELTADAEFLTTPERLAEIIGKKNARIAELEADKRRMDRLETLLANNKYHSDLAIQWDEEDRIWFAKIYRFDHGELRGEPFDPTDSKTATVRAAIDAIPENAPC